MGRNEPHSTRTRAPGELELEPVASTKLSPPRGARLMPRDALLARMLEARRKRCLLLQGPAGCGKTSMLVSWRQALMGLDFDIAWLSLSAEDNELGRFFDCLLASLAQVDPAIVREVAYLVGHGSDAPAVEHWVIKLVQGVSSRARDLVLILDDLHHVDDPRVAQALQWLLDYAPANLHLAIGSRAAAPFATARLRAQDQLTEFDLHDLRFTREESERFLRERLESIDTNDARSLHELTDGWVAGLQLYAVDLKTRRGGEHARVQLRDARAFADYFEREVVVHIAPDDLKLLTRVALCNRFCASLSAALLGEPHALARMTTRLVRLDRDNLFISQVSAHDQETWYRLHPLLREVLQARAAGLGDDAVRALHGIAWRWFSAHGYIDEAVRHAVQAGELAAATDLVEACAEDLLARGALSRLAGLMRRLPADHVQASFRLLLMTAYLQMHARDLDGLRASLRRMECSRQAIDQPQRYRVSLLRGGLAMQCDDTDAVQAIEAELLAIPDDADPIALAGRSHVLAWMFMYRGEYAKAEDMLEQGARYSAGSDRHLVGRCLAGMRLTLEGRMGEAEGLIRETLREAERPGAPEIGIVCVAAGLLGEVLYEFDELEAVCSLLEDRIGVLERISIPDTVLRAMVALSGAQWLLGQRAEAMARMERLEHYAIRQDLPRLLASALAVRLRWHATLGNVELAQALLERIVALGARYAGAPPGIGADIDRCVERARAEASLFWNNFDEAASRLKSLIRLLESVGRWAGVAAARVQLAVALRGRGDVPGARAMLVDALRIGHRFGLTRSLLDASAELPAMLEDLVEDSDLNPVLAFYAKRLLAASERTRARGHSGAEARGASPVAGRLSERELEVLNLLAQAMPNKKIARVLGVTPHTVKWHLRKIYDKLGVNHRDEAVARMRNIAGVRTEP
jgi:LuxR family maltose regulon positive regulatory protein